MKVFISWSGNRSGTLANAVKSLLKALLGVEVWMSKDISPGTRWLETLNQNLEKSDWGVLCLTPENLDSSWLLFEAGALAKKSSEGRALPYLLGVAPGELTLPLSQFQGSDTDRNGTLDLVKKLNSTLTPPLDETALLEQFEALWPELENTIALLRASKHPFSAREVEQERQKAHTFWARAAGAWWERVRDDGIGFFQIELDNVHNSVRVANGRFYNEDATFAADFNSTITRVEQEGSKEGIRYLRECHNPARDVSDWFHGYGVMWFQGSAESFDHGLGTFYDLSADDPRKVVVKQVRLQRADDEEEAIKTMERTSADQKALVQRMIDALKFA